MIREMFETIWDYFMALIGFILDIPVIGFFFQLFLGFCGGYAISCSYCFVKI